MKLWAWPSLGQGHGCHSNKDLKWNYQCFQQCMYVYILHITPNCALLTRVESFTAASGILSSVAQASGAVAYFTGVLDNVQFGDLFLVTSLTGVLSCELIVCVKLWIDCVCEAVNWLCVWSCELIVCVKLWIDCVCLWVMYTVHVYNVRFYMHTCMYICVCIWTTYNLAICFW